MGIRMYESDIMSTAQVRNKQKYEEKGQRDCRTSSCSESDSLTRSGSPRRAQDHYRHPVARLPSATPNPSSDLHSPAGPLGPLRIKAFNPIPGREVHLPSAPDCPSLPGIVSILLVRYQITAPGSLSVQWFAVPQPACLHHAYVFSVG
jgi:hypothetical protein